MPIAHAPIGERTIHDMPESPPTNPAQTRIARQHREERARKTIEVRR
jgi:hypothetical protein